MENEDLSSQVFGRLTALELVRVPDKNGRLWGKWRCKCICGNEKIIFSKSLKSGSTKSCGCLQNEPLHVKMQYKSGLHLNRMKSRYAENKLKGLCRCGNILTHNYKQCYKCKVSAKRRYYHRVRLNRQNGLCLCGRPLTPNRKRCSRCLEHWRNWKKVRVRKPIESQSLRAYIGILVRYYRKQKKKISYRSETSRQRIIDFKLTADDLIKLWHNQNGLCAISGLQMLHHQKGGLEAASIDRKDCSLGYELDNVQLVCRWANFAKNKYTDRNIKLILEKIRQQMTNVV